MTYAVRGLDLWCSEAGRVPPLGFTVVDAAAFRMAWRSRDYYAFERMKAAAAAPLINPLEAA